MGFDILLIGILLLINPIHEITDALAAVLISVALRRGGKYVTEFSTAAKFAIGIIPIGLAEIVFCYLFPLTYVGAALSIAREAMLIPLLIYLLRGIMELAKVAENALLFDRAKGLLLPTYVLVGFKAIATVAIYISKVLFPIYACAWVGEATLLIMIFIPIFTCYKTVNVYPGAVQEDREQ